MPVVGGDVLMPLAVGDDAHGIADERQGAPSFVVEKFIISTPAWVYAQLVLPPTSKPGIESIVPLPTLPPTGTLSQNSTLIWLNPFCIAVGRDRVTFELSFQ